MTDKTDPSVMSPSLANNFVAGTLARIKATQPDFYPFVLRALHAEAPNFQLNGLGEGSGGIFDIVSNVFSKAASAYGDVVINRENAKTQSMIASDNAKSQIAIMNAQLKAQQAQTTDAFAQQQLALQQQQLLKGSAAFGGGLSTQTTVMLAIGGLALVGVLVATRPRV